MSDLAQNLAPEKRSEKRAAGRAARAARRELPETAAETAPHATEHTLIGWQGIRCALPAEWNVSGFSMERDNGYLRIDGPGASTLTVQIRWLNAAANGSKGGATPAQVVAERYRKLLRRPAPPQPKPDLRANLDQVFKETGKQSRKSKSTFESTVKPERTEGEHGERTSINFSWVGAGRGQGKIWHCSVCNRVVIAQVMGLMKDNPGIAAVASQLFSTLSDHSESNYDFWGLYGLRAEIPTNFKLVEQKLLSGYLHLGFRRGGERITVDRWGLANVTLRKFRLDEWLATNSTAPTRRMRQETAGLASGHEIVHLSGQLPVAPRLRGIREAAVRPSACPSRYEAGVWSCEQSNRIYAVQMHLHPRSVRLYDEVINRCVCH